MFVSSCVWPPPSSVSSWSLRSSRYWWPRTRKRRIPDPEWIRSYSTSLKRALLLLIQLSGHGTWFFGSCCCILRCGVCHVGTLDLRWSGVTGARREFDALCCRLVNAHPRSVDGRRRRCRRATEPRRARLSITSCAIPTDHAVTVTDHAVTVTDHAVTGHSARRGSHIRCRPRACRVDDTYAE